MSIRLLVVDDHPAIREGFRVLARAAGIVIAGEATTAETAVALAQDHSVEVVVIGLGLSVSCKLDVLSRIKACRPELPILLYASDDSSFFLAQGRARGASGYLVKGRDEAVLVEAIQRAAAGDDLWSIEPLNGLPRREQAAVPAQRGPAASVSGSVASAGRS
jgi:DNA-binding NarL/FixJ family response regulator